MVFRRLFPPKKPGKSLPSTNYRNINGPRDWVPADFPDLVKRVFELTYLSIQNGLSGDEIIERMPRAELKMSNDIANEIYKMTFKQWNYDFVASMSISKILGNEIGIDPKGAFQVLIHSIIYYFRRGNSTGQIIEKALNNEFMFGNFSDLSEDVVIKLIERTAMELNSKIQTQQ